MTAVLTVQMPSLFPYQREIIEHPARFKIVRVGRRGGKTRTATAAAAARTFLGDRGAWIAPTYQLTTRGWGPLRRMFAEVPGSEIRISDRKLISPSGGILSVGSADKPDSLRGEGWDFVVVEEAAFMKPEAWYEVIRPSLTDRGGSAIFITTPNGYNWFFDLEEEARKRDDWVIFHHPTSVNPIIPPEEIELAREELGSMVFSQEYLAEYVELGGNVFQREWFRYYDLATDANGDTWLRVNGHDYAAADADLFCTVDLAASTKETADYTVIASCAVTEGKLFVLEVVRKRLEGPDIVPAIRQQLERWGLRMALIEKTGFQLSLVQQARRAGLPVGELRADRDKRSRAWPLAARMEAGDVYFRRDADWLDELEKELLVFPAGDHDDQVDAMAYASSKLSRRRWGAR